MKRYLTFAAACCLAACSGGDKKPLDTPKEQLVHALFAHVEKGEILFGHQDDLCYGHAWQVTDWENDPLDRSDVKDVCGQYPAVLGFDLGGVELGWEANLDGVPFGLIRKAAQTHIARGGVVTFSWHLRNPLTGGDAWDVSSNQAVRSVLPGGEKHPEFMVWLQRAADFVESIGQPVILRPWHEHMGSWFWWGKDLCTDSEYQELFRMTWLYFTKERGLEDLLWCFSPNGPIEPEVYMQRYPGDEFVDILGTDIYEYIGPDGLEEAGVRFNTQVKSMLTALNVMATDHHKLLCLSETGLGALADPHWWTEVLYPAITDYPICYVLTWRNAHDQPEHFFAPWKGFGNEPDFVAFTQKEDIVML